ncbi:cell division ATP-binding protein FtsE [Desulfovibrio litoralis]|uniref:Cell division transport system ATP-binding protein n=1 Tax=Desulfovibrio litoralis DSM 11393 TaxID=1121455 RepID=A0A1M7SA50_9BACT|nr:ATP-binding cassette domain-containing protein [Desulfovibrio litoralis]SHN55142.1 cell division transport system ATP-binding protein [Desulfovibrio litoralis DSM 11393]
MIKAKHVSLNFGSHWALKNCSFSLDKGDFLFLSGPSGAGKTSLLRLLYADLAMQRGQAEIAGFRLDGIKKNQIPNLRRQVSVVFQDFRILPNETVYQNIALPLEIRGLGHQHIERRVKAVARALSLENRLFFKCCEISGGEQQRTAIARSFVINPQVLLADEPTGNLDPDLSLRLMDLFLRFQAYGATVILATHSHDLLRLHPKAKIMRLEDGKITYANWSGAEIFRSAEEPTFG